MYKYALTSLNNPWRTHFMYVGCFLLSSPLWAAGGVESSHHHEPHVSNVWGIGAAYASTPAIGWMFITFSIFVGALIFFLRKPLNAKLEARALDVKKALEEAKAAQATAEAKSREAEEKLRALDVKIAEIRATFEAQGKAEATRLDAAAAESSARIQKNLEMTIQAEGTKAQTELRQEAARLALDMAMQRIRSVMGPGDEVRFRSSLVQELENHQDKSDQDNQA